MYLGVTIIDDKFAGAFLDNDASDGAFTSTGANETLGGETTGKPRFHVLLEVCSL